MESERSEVHSERVEMNTLSRNDSDNLEAGKWVETKKRGKSRTSTGQNAAKK